MAVLTQRDVARLLKEHSAAARAETAAKLGAEFSGGEMDSSARAIAEEIFRMMLRDAEVRVRKELSESLKHSPLVVVGMKVVHWVPTGEAGCCMTYSSQPEVPVNIHKNA